MSASPNLKKQATFLESLEATDSKLTSKPKTTLVSIGGKGELKFPALSENAVPETFKIKLKVDSEGHFEIDSKCFSLSRVLSNFAIFGRMHES